MRNILFSGLIIGFVSLNLHVYAMEDESAFERLWAALCDKEMPENAKLVLMKQAHDAGVDLNSCCDSEAFGRHREICVPLSYAIEYNLTEIVEWLLSNNVHRDVKCAIGGPLRTAAYHDCQPLLRLLLERQFDPNYDQAGIPALHQAAADNNCRAAELLLAFGADPFLRATCDEQLHKDKTAIDRASTLEMQLLLRMFVERHERALLEVGLLPEVASIVVDYLPICRPSNEITISL